MLVAAPWGQALRAGQLDGLPPGPHTTAHSPGGRVPPAHLGAKCPFSLPAPLNEAPWFSRTRDTWALLLPFKAHVMRVPLPSGRRVRTGHAQHADRGGERMAETVRSFPAPQPSPRASPHVACAAESPEGVRGHAVSGRRWRRVPPASCEAHAAASWGPWGSARPFSEAAGVSPRHGPRGGEAQSACE